MKLILLCLSDVLLILAGIVYGVKFLKKRNYLCGLEWLIMSLSGTNFLLWAIFGWSFCYDTTFFFDAFSRSFGFPVVAVAGMMFVTHQYKPSWRADVLYFLLGFVGATGVVLADHHPALAACKPPFFVATCAIFLAYLANFALKLHKAGETLHVLGVCLVAATGAAIASFEDYVPFPGGDDAYRTTFFTAALTVWAFMMVELYYAYCALERATQARSGRFFHEPLGQARLRRQA